MSPLSAWRLDQADETHWSIQREALHESSRPALDYIDFAACTANPVAVHNLTGESCDLCMDVAVSNT